MRPSGWWWADGTGYPSRDPELEYNKQNFCRNSASRHGSWSGVRPKPSEFVRDEASRVELSEPRCRMRQEVGLTPRALVILLSM